MYPNSFSTYKIRLKDKEFVSKAGITYSQTACVSLLNEYGQEIYYVELGFITASEIFQKIEKAEAINLDEALVENFDICKFVDNEKDTISVKCFSAKNAIFSSDTATNFSGINFIESSADFQGALFIKGDVLFEKCMFIEGNANFNSVIFYSGNVSFYDANFVKGTINFKNCYFGKGTKNFQYTFWGNGDILFSNSYFNDGNVNFVNSSFGDGEISFKICSFGKGNIDFKYSVFGNSTIIFERTEFGNGFIDFSRSEFGQCKINFNKAIFGKAELIFDEVEVAGGKLNFKHLYFEEGVVRFEIARLSGCAVYFDKSVFKQVNVSFYKSKINTLSLKACQINSYADLRLSECHQLDLSDTFIHDIVDLSLEEKPTAIKCLNLFGCRLMGHLFLSWKANQVYKQITSFPSTDHKKNAWQFNLLKRNFNSIGFYDDEDLAYVAFKREELNIEAQNISNLPVLVKPLAWFKYWFKRLVFDQMGLYATSPLRVFYSIIIIWALFGFVYTIFHYLGWGKTWSSVGNPDHISIVAQSFYHSAITFFTIGYGDVFPQGISRVISSFEGFVGVFMMSYFTVAFVRKVLR